MEDEDEGKFGSQPYFFGASYKVGEGSLLLPLGLTYLNEILALDPPPSMHTYP